MKFNKYGIQYQPHSTIKAQALSDFLAKMLGEKKKEVWKVFVDGSTTKQGGGVGVLLISP